MKYEQMREKIEKNKNKMWRYGCQWLRLAVDVETGNLVLAHRRLGDWNREPENSNLLITPRGEVIFPTGSCSSQILGTFGMPGRFRNYIRPYFRYAY